MNRCWCGSLREETCLPIIELNHIPFDHRPHDWPTQSALLRWPTPLDPAAARTLADGLGTELMLFCGGEHLGPEVSILVLDKNSGPAQKTETIQV